MAVYLLPEGVLANKGQQSRRKKTSWEDPSVAISGTTNTMLLLLLLLLL
jgi:hypothetical protein